MSEDPTSADGLVEPLTRREREILALLADNLSGPEIAEKLTLALSSVRWHLQQIYGKLGVNNKRQAVARARELGLLRSESPASPASSTPELRPGQLLPTGTVTLQTRPHHNLPLQLTSFIGRDKEIAAVQALLGKTPGRLVTLTGSGGVGKTRLALQAAAGLLASGASFPDGVWLVELAPLADPEHVPQAAAIALDVRETPGRPAMVALTDFLRAKHLLLILDNCEHLAAACAELAQHLLQACPRLHILATSQERLGVAGETTFPVPSLSTPGTLEPVDLETVRQYEAVRLFIERVQTISPAFLLNQENAPAVLKICQRLDGIPLAIELAAARARLLSVGQIAARLDDAFRLLAGGSRAALPRHQTLRALIDWSYHMLTAPEQIMLQKLSVFAGGWTLEAAEAACPECDVLDWLSQLVDKSLVIVSQDKSGEEPRYHMLETIRQYASEKLKEAGGSEQAREQHLAYFLRLAERIEPELRGRHQVARLDQLEEELGNLRLALGWALQADLQAELRLASALKMFSHYRGRRPEILEWVEQGLARIQAPGGPQISPALRARALEAAGFLHTFEGIKLDQAAAELEESRSIYRELGPSGKAGAADTLLWQAHCEYGKGESLRAVAFCREGLALSRELKDPFGTGTFLYSLGISLDGSDPGNREARQLVEESLALFLENGPPDGTAAAYLNMGRLDYADRELDRAKTLWEHSLSYFQQVGNREMISGRNTSLALIAHIQGDYQAASEYSQKDVAIQRDIGNPDVLGAALLDGGLLCACEGDNALARRRLEEALALCQKVDNQWRITFIHLLLGKLAWAEGDRELAERKLAEALAAGREVNNPDLAANLLTFQSILAWAGGDEQGAKAGLKEALKTAGKISFSISFLVGFYIQAAPLVLDALAQMKASRQPEKAARLFGAAEHFNWAYAYLMDPMGRAGRQAALGQVRAALGEARMAALWAEGGAITSDQVIAYALEEEEGVGSR